MSTPKAREALYLEQGIIKGVRHRLAIRFAVDGDLRFLSHHDTLRLFERALARAEIPVRYSEGFNPRPRISVVLPRSVGVAGDDEMLVVELSREALAEEVLAALARQMPEGVAVRSAEFLPPTGTPQPRRAAYRLPLYPEQTPELAQRTAELLNSTAREIERRNPKTGTAKRIDLRPYVETIDLLEGALSWTQAILPTGTIRPDEMLAALGLPGRDHHHRLRRVQVWYGLSTDEPV